MFFNDFIFETKPVSKVDQTFFGISFGVFKQGRREVTSILSDFFHLKAALKFGANLSFKKAIEALYIMAKGSMDISPPEEKKAIG